MLNVLMIAIRFIIPYTNQILNIITGIDWTWRKAVWIIGICGLLFSGYSLYNSGYKSCQLEVVKQNESKSKTNSKIRNSAVDSNVVIDKLLNDKF